MGGRTRRLGRPGLRGPGLRGPVQCDPGPRGPVGCGPVGCGPVKGPVRPSRRGQAAGRAGWARAGRPHRRHGQQDWYRTAGRAARPPGRARMAGSGCRRPAVRGRYQPEPACLPGGVLGPGLPGHGMLTAEPAVHAAAGRGPAAAGRHEDREDQRRGHGRACGRGQHRRHDGGGAEEVSDGLGEHQPRHRHDGHQPARRSGITDHGQPLSACMPSKGGRAPLPSYS